MWGQDRFNEPTEQKTGNELDPEGMSEDFCGSEFGPVCGLVGTSVSAGRGLGLLGRGSCHTNEGQREGRVARNRGMPSGILSRM